MFTTITIRGDRDARGVVELGAGTNSVAEPSSAAAGECGGRPSCDVDPTNKIAASVRNERERRRGWCSSRSTALRTVEERCAAAGGDVTCVVCGG